MVAASNLSTSMIYLVTFVVVVVLILISYMSYLYHLRTQTRLRDEVRSIFYEYYPLAGEDDKGSISQTGIYTSLNQAIV